MAATRGMTRPLPEGLAAAAAAVTQKTAGMSERGADMTAYQQSGG